MKVLLIFNPTAGGEGGPTESQLVALIKDAGHKVTVASTASKDWHRSLKKPSADLIAVAGGDGTVGKVARRMVGKDVPIAILPVGTANNVSKTLGIAGLAVTELIPGWETARHLRLDVGLASGPWGERYFIEGFGIGLLSNSIPTLEANKTFETLPDNAAKVAYAQQLLRERLGDCAPIEIEASLDGNDISGRYLMLEILNIEYVGPNLFLAPEILTSKGEFEVVLASQQHRDKLHDGIKNWQEGELRPLEIATRRGKHLQIRWTGFSIHIDDKVWPARRGRRPEPPALVEISLQPDAVDFLIPEDVHQIRHALAT